MTWAQVPIEALKVGVFISIAGGVVAVAAVVMWGLYRLMDYVWDEISTWWRGCWLSWAGLAPPDKGGDAT